MVVVVVVVVVVRLVVAFVVARLGFLKLTFPPHFFGFFFQRARSRLPGSLSFCASMLSTKQVNKASRRIVSCCIRVPCGFTYAKFFVDLIKNEGHKTF